MYPPRLLEHRTQRLVFLPTTAHHVHPPRPEQKRSAFTNESAQKTAADLRYCFPWHSFMLSYLVLCHCVGYVLVDSNPRANKTSHRLFPCHTASSTSANVLHGWMCFYSLIPVPANTSNPNHVPLYYFYSTATPTLLPPPLLLLLPLLLLPLHLEPKSDREIFAILIGG